mmetsp:Transcript_43028/g.77192  ORF Transcript_43028/g.77192 Transcript_43028/m.77192 type:complete len:102 (+) Transcript_43028:29-334(+)
MYAHLFIFETSQSSPRCRAASSSPGRAHAAAAVQTMPIQAHSVPSPPRCLSAPAHPEDLRDVSLDERNQWGCFGAGQQLHASPISLQPQLHVNFEAIYRHR